MNNAASLRSIPAVAAFDTTDQLEAYGFKVAHPQALEIARNLVDDVVSETLRVADQHFTGLKTIGQNPYRDKLFINRDEVRYAALVQLFDDGWLPSRVDRVFAEPKGLPRPALPNLHQRIMGELAKKLESHGFELLGAEQHRDGTLSRIAVRDPVYAAEAASQARTMALDGLDGLGAALSSLESGQTGKTPMGIRNMRGATTAAEIAKFVDEVADAALIVVRDHLQGIMNAGGNPYEDTPAAYQQRYVHVIDPKRVKIGFKKNVYIPKSAIVRLDELDELAQRAERQFHGRAQVDRDPFVMYVASVVGKRLRAYPELRAAAVCVAHGKFGRTYDGWRLVAVCAPELVSPFKRVWQSTFGKPKVLALPAPEVKALPAAPIEVPPANWTPDGAAPVPELAR